jgi:hypothetical protein
MLRLHRADALSFKSTPKPLLLEHHIQCVDDANLRICFAIYNHFMLEVFRSGYVKEVFLRESVVPAAVPGGEPVGISLPSAAQVSACTSIYPSASA